MTQHSSILEAFVKLGTFFSDYLALKRNNNALSTSWENELEQIVSRAKHHNGWFTEENMLFTLSTWSDQLTNVNLEKWLSDYDLSKNKTKKVAIIMAGNIPLVGFHDFLATLITGNSVLVKLSSNDAHLLPFISRYLKHIGSSLEGMIDFTEARMEHFDVVIATGSDNTSRYFEHYFGKYPNIIRKNRNSVAVLTGNETKEQLAALGEDIFRYYGLGCRSVSKLYVPEGYDFDLFFKSMFDFNDIMNSAKYANNYDYNKAVYLMSEFKLLENGFLILKEDESYASPIASLFYEHYSSVDGIKQKLIGDSEKLQCVVSNGILENEIPFGATQIPKLSDYADSIDTVEFLLKT